MENFSQGMRAPLATLDYMSKTDDKMHTIFGNYSSHNYIRIHFRKDPIEPFLTNVLKRSHPRFRA